MVEDYETIITELEAYGGHLADKPRITALNKIDALEDEDRDAKLDALRQATGGEVFAMSGVSRDGLQNVLRAVRACITEDRIREKKSLEEPKQWRP